DRLSRAERSRSLVAALNGPAGVGGRHRRGFSFGRCTRLAARRTLPPTDQDDDPDDRGSDANLDSSVPVERSKHWGQYTRAASCAPMAVLCSRWRSHGVGSPYLSPRGVNRTAPLRGIAMRKLMCRVVGISCAGIALVVLEAAWLAAVCHRRARAREHPTWV